MNSHTRAALTEDLEKIYDTLDLNTVLGRTLNFLSAKISCQNIMWIMAEEYMAIMRANGSYVPQDGLDRDVMLTAQSEISDKMALYNIRLFNFPDVYLNSTDVKLARSAGVDSSANYWKPLRDSKTNRMLGAFIFIGVPSDDQLAFEEKLEDMFGLMKQHLIFSIEHFRVKNLSFVDDVTSLYNQRYLSLVLEREVSRAKRNGHEFSLLFLDVDYFKLVNDTRGHIVGSIVLIEIANLLKEQLRTNDYAFRYGGDEFVILLVDTGVQQAEVVAERIRKKVEETPFRIDGPEVNLTVSIGIAGFPDHAKSSEQVIRLADQAMYDAKNKSRNIVYVTAS